MKNLLVLNLPPYPLTYTMREKGGYFKTRKFFYYSESFLYFFISLLFLWINADDLSVLARSIDAPQLNSIVYIGDAI